MDMHGARNLEGRAVGEAHCLDRGRVGQPEAEHGSRLRRCRKHLDGDLGHDGERAPRAGQAASEVVAGDVLHHPAARLDISPRPLTAFDAEQMVARRAGKDAPAAGDVGGDHPADRALAGAVAKHGAEIDRLEGSI